MATMAQLYGPTQLLILGKRIHVTFYPEKLRHTVAVKASWCFDGDNHVRALANEEYGHGAKDRLLHQIEAAARHFLLEAMPNCPPVLLGLLGVDGGAAHSLQAHLLEHASSLFVPVQYVTTLPQSECNGQTSRHVQADEFETLRRSAALLALHDGQHISWAVNSADILALKDDFRCGLIACRAGDWQALREYADSHGVHTRGVRVMQGVESMIGALLRKYHDESTRQTASYSHRIAHILEQHQSLQAFSAYDSSLDLEQEFDMVEAARSVIRDLKLFATRAVLNADHSEPASAG